MNLETRIRYSYTLITSPEINPMGSPVCIVSHENSSVLDFLNQISYNSTVNDKVKKYNSHVAITNITYEVIDEERT